MHHNKGYLNLCIVALIVFKIFALTLGDDSKGSVQEKIFETDGNKAQEISIFVQPRADEDNSGSSDGENAEDIPEAITLTDCQSTNDCCYQYTWPGTGTPVPAAVNNTCEWLKASKGESMACFDPLVYLHEEGSQKGGPNMEELKAGASASDWKIYCRKGDQNCMKFKFFNNNKERGLINETAFCGTVHEKLTDKAVTNGCFSEKVAGVIREVCVCDRPTCNTGVTAKFSRLHVLSISFLTLILSQFKFY